VNVFSETYQILYFDVRPIHSRIHSHRYNSRWGIWL